MILFDTDVMIDVLRNHPSALRWAKTISTQDVVLPGFVALELVQGCKNKVELDKVERALQRYQVAWPSPTACDRALQLYIQHRLSQGLSIFDALVGQMAVDLNLPLYTFNQRHYALVPNLQIVQPYQR